jgi:hypothetical protein
MLILVRLDNVEMLAITIILADPTISSTIHLETCL